MSNGLLDVPSILTAVVFPISERTDPQGRHRSNFQERFDADDPDTVSLVETDGADSVESAWEAVSEWKSLKRRVELLDAARRDDLAVER
ncbi:hypothetical protein [Halapricum hydrolyticum]|uniref:Uncharacterized protein n=1 Tax=Halapricum hydrolyticum TaxID=2979991 RepID=A0AAE3ICU7_9EURY|nr:hypothetical protein [Halapricum hydrolyticum]MCU4719307.1 hypothetical protein [Halapricum hydrolyticum]MCU4728248.1 hypothetical protein [Halapricum hydrolyticum]